MTLELEQSDEKHWVCGCCGDTSHTVWGWVHEVGEGTLAAYFVSWADQGSHRPHVTLGYGAWGENTTAADRRTINLELTSAGEPVLVDHSAPGAPEDQSEVLGQALRAAEVESDPQRPDVLETADFVLARDERLRSVSGGRLP